MHWNHRVMKRERDGEIDFSIREVFYDDDETIEMWTAEEMDPHGETIGELRKDLERMLACLELPVLDEAEELRLSEERQANQEPS